MYAAGTWNDWQSETRGVGPDVSEYFPPEPQPARPASAGGVSASLSYCQEHHPFERSFPYAPKAALGAYGGSGSGPTGGGVSFWGEEDENPAATHPGIEDEDMPTFGNMNRASGWDRPPSPPFASHHHERVHSYGGYDDPTSPEAGQYSTVFANTMGLPPSPQDRGGSAQLEPSWMSDMSLLDPAGGESSDYGDAMPYGEETAMLDQTWMSSDGPLTDDVRMRAVDRREKSYVDVLGQRPMPLDEAGLTAWGSAHAKQLCEDHDPGVKAEDMQRRGAF